MRAVGSCCLGQPGWSFCPSWRGVAGVGVGLTRFNTWRPIIFDSATTYYSYTSAAGVSYVMILEESSTNKTVNTVPHSQLGLWPV